MAFVNVAHKQNMLNAHTNITSCASAFFFCVYRVCVRAQVSYGLDWFGSLHRLSSSLNCTDRSIQVCTSSSKMVKCAQLLLLILRQFVSLYCQYFLFFSHFISFRFDSRGSQFFFAHYSLFAMPILWCAAVVNFRAPTHLCVRKLDNLLLCYMFGWLYFNFNYICFLFVCFVVVVFFLPVRSSLIIISLNSFQRFIR